MQLLSLYFNLKKELCLLEIAEFDIESNWTMNQWCTSKILMMAGSFYGPLFFILSTLVEEKHIRNIFHVYFS